MRILLIMDAAIPVPPPLYGGHERLVAMFAEEYEKLGHEVSLLAGPGSVWKRLRTYGKNGYFKSKKQRIKEVIQVWKFLYQHHHEYDLIHNFGRLLYLIPVLNKPSKKIMTYGRDVTGWAIKKINSLPHKHLIFTACSDYCVSTGNTAGTWRTVYNAIDFSKYELKEHVEKDAPLMFLGRIEEIKGTHTAIKVALATGNKLWIAGNIDPDHQSFFDLEIKPYLDEANIIYLGAINDEQKNFYLGKAKALLFPIAWEEPFGMVMVEAMACGTPVIAFARGAVLEVVKEGETGFIVANEANMFKKVNEIQKINRLHCRNLAQIRFDVSIIAAEYLNLFKYD